MKDIEELLRGKSATTGLSLLHQPGLGNEARPTLKTLYKHLPLVPFDNDEYLEIQKEKK